MSGLAKRFTRDLTIRYVAVLVTLAGLTLASFLGVARFFLDARDSVAVINTAGRQRMLVERSALLAARLASGQGGNFRPGLTAALDELEARHDTLLQELTVGYGRAATSRLHDLFFDPGTGVDAAVHDFLRHGRAITGTGGTAADMAAMQTAADGPLLAALDRIAEAYVEENEGKLQVAMLFHGGTLVLMLLALTASGLFIFRPLVRRIGANINERLEVERSLRESEKRLWRILEDSPVGVSVSRRKDGRVVFANGRFCRIIGRDRHQVIGHPARSHYVDEAQRRMVVSALKSTGRIADAEVEFLRRDGSKFWSLLTVGSMTLEREEVNLAWLYDISALKAAEERQRLTAKVVESANEAVVITNARNEIQFVNPAFTAITEYTPDEVMGRNPSMLQSGRHDRDFYATLWRRLLEKGRWQGEVWNRRKSGEFFAEWLSIVVLRDAAGAVSHHIAVFSDITHRKEDEARVWRQANYDPLTGLPNRLLFMDRLGQAIRQGRRDHTCFALMFLDLDGFKQVNDTLGHAAGDQLLQHAAVRMAECTRASDTVARLAGDEFTIIVQGVHERADAARLAGKVVATLAEPFPLDAGTVHVGASIGVAWFDGDGHDAASLLAAADSAMYAVKKNGKNGYRLAD